MIEKTKNYKDREGFLMKRSLWIILLSFAFIIIFILSGLLLNCSEKKNRNIWLFKINEKVTTLGEFEKEYELYLENLGLRKKEISRAKKSVELKSGYLQVMKNQNLIYYRAITENYENRDDIKVMLRLLKKQLIITAFVKDKMGDRIEISEKDIEEYYNNNREMYKTTDVITAGKQIEYKLLREKYDTEIMELVNELVKESSIKDNPDAMILLGDY
ncbi:MAG: hypothetical protein KAS39_02895 [Actinomycetia bacterium]|nr:hypothetical protein [Actinomycetes bacterium]